MFAPPPHGSRAGPLPPWSACPPPDDDEDTDDPAAGHDGSFGRELMLALIAGPGAALVMFVGKMTRDWWQARLAREAREHSAALPGRQKKTTHEPSRRKPPAAQ